jgi:mono/diheme cytochrome c family protein
MRFARLPLVSGLCFAIAACAVVPKPETQDFGFRRPTPAEARGREFAYRRCGGCHNVGRDDVSREGPPFMKLARRYDSRSLRQRFAEVSEHGYQLMQPVTFNSAEASDLLAYVNSLTEPYPLPAPAKAHPK